MVIVESAGITDVGMKRKGNEDSLFIDKEQNLYVVADGMGGHKAGEVASMLVVDTIRDYMKRFKDDQEAEELDEYDETLSLEANRLVSSIKLANRGVYYVSGSKKKYKGMGSTVSSVYITDKHLIAANVGDSPIYLVHNGNIELISVIHNVINEQAAIDPEAAKLIGDEFKHMLTRGMGIKETVEPDIFELPYFKGDTLIISSDGLSDMVSPEEILEVVEKEHPEKTCKLLVKMANDRGGNDNITIIILKIKKVIHGKNRIMEMISPITLFLKKIFN